MENPAEVVQETSDKYESDVINNEIKETEIQYQSPEILQRKLYFLLENLKTMHSALPE